MKTCACCGESKEITEFSIDKQRLRGIATYCRPCKAIRAKKYNGSHARKAQKMMQNYGLTFEAYNAILETQGGHCALCPRTYDMCVDHDHTTLKIRGILCRKCNLMLGHGDDDATRLRAAVTYLEKHK